TLGRAGLRRVNELGVVGRHLAPRCAERHLAGAAGAAERVRDRGHRQRERVERCAPRERGGVRPWARRRPEAAELLDSLRDQGRRRPVEPVRTREASDELAHLTRVLLALLERPRELLQVLLEVSRDVQESAVLPAEIVEVERALLRPREGGIGDGEDGLADDPGLDQAARVDPDDAGAVGERVEVARPRLAGVRLLPFPRPDDRVRVAEVDVAPLRGVLRVRADEDTDLREALPDRGQPTADEADLVRRRLLNSSGVVDGRRSNQSSNRCAPVRTTRSAGIPWISTSSCRWISFQTKTRSGTNLSRPLPVRLSQLATQIPVRIPSARAAFRYSTCEEANSITGLASTASGC